MSEKDVCSNCREEHRTSTCKNMNKLFCVACNEVTHASWSRDCLEFNRRCLIFDGRNPKNVMPHFPMEQDWTLMVRPSSIPLEDRYPERFTVNTLPTSGSSWQQVPRTCQYRGQGHNTKDRNGHDNPNQIQIPPNHIREEGTLPDGSTRWHTEVNTGDINMDRTAPYNLPGWN